MAKVEDFILRFKVQGEQTVKNVSGTIQNLSDDIASFGSGAGGFNSTIGAITSKLGPLGLAATAAGAAFGALGGRALQIAAQLGDISGATGIAAGQLQNFQTSVIEAGGAADDFGQIAAKLNQNVQEAAGGNQKLQDAFRTLGVFVTDTNGKVRNTGDILADVTARFQSGQLSSAQYSAAVDILGRNITKLDIAKLSALRDPVADADIARLDAYNEAIDRIRDRLSRGIVTFFGSVAEQADKALKKVDELYNYQENRERKLNEQGKTIGGRLRTELTLGLNNFFPRDMTEEEKKLFREQGQSPAGFKFGSTPPAVTPPPAMPAGAGGFGDESAEAKKLREQAAKASEDSEKRIAKITQDLRLASEKNKGLITLSEALGTADKNAAITLKAENDIKNIKLANEAEIAKARIDIFAQENLSKEQLNKEFEAKRLQLSAQAEEQITAVRARSADELKKELDRINEIITRSKDLTTEQQRINQLQGDRNVFLQQNVTATDRERANAEALFTIEQDRIRALRQISQLIDLPANERISREKEINAEFEKRRSLTTAQQQADIQAIQNFSVGYERAYKQYIENSRNAATYATDIFNKFASSLEDNLVKSLNNGKLAWKEFLLDIVNQLLRSNIQSLLANILGGPGGMSKSGSTLGNIFKGLMGFANGGIIPTNGPVIVGERGPEILSGVSGRVVTPNNQIGGGSVTYNINAVDAMSFKSMIAADPTFLYAVTEQGRRRLPGGM